MSTIGLLGFSIFTAVSVVATQQKPIDLNTLKDKVSIKLNQEFVVEFKRDGGRLLEPTRTDAANAKQPMIRIKLDVTSASPIPGPRDGATRPFLHIDNFTDRTLHYRALVRYQGSKEFFAITDGVEPIPPGEGANKCWGFESQVEEVVLYQFTLSRQPTK
jgi:hypothetical protein